MINLSDLLELDELQLFFREPYHLNEHITLYQPTIGDIIQTGERQYYSMVHTLTSIPSDMKSRLWDMGIDWEEISDFDFFIMLTRQMDSSQTKLLLGDLDLSKLIIAQNTQNGEIVLKDENSDLIIDKLLYLKIVAYIRKLHNITPKIEKAANEATKKILIDLDRQKIEKAEKETYKSQLYGLISGMMRYPGFKYKSTELKECGLYEFMDAVQGAQIYISSTALLQGSYSGMIDTSGINKNNFNWMRTINES